MPRSGDQFETLDFAAPIGARVRLVTLLVLAVLAGLMIVNGMLTWSRLPDQQAFWPMVLGPAIALLVTAPIAFFSVVRGYRLVGTELHVIRFGRINRFSLAGLTTVEADREALSGAWKKLGNDGLGAITGRFSSRKLGAFEALVTDPGNAVVLSWPERRLVISPDRTAYFVECVRERTGRSR